MSLLRRYPVTSSVVGIIVAVGVATGALWSNVSTHKDLYETVAYGAGPLREGRVWTFIYGSFLLPEPVLYGSVLLLLIGALGTYEGRVGHWPAAIAVVGGQVGSTLLAALFFWPFQDSGWTWAARLSGTVDVGMSAGGFTALAALTAVMEPVWRTRVRTIGSAYLIAMMLTSGLLWDVEHLVAWTIGLAFGPMLAGQRHPQLPPLHFGRRTQRALVALIIGAQAAATLVEALFPGNGGPFHTSGEAVNDNATTLYLALTAFVWLLVADGLRRGRRFAWGFVTISMALTIVALFTESANAERTANFILIGAQLVLLLVTFRAFEAHSRRRSLRHAGMRLVTVAAFLFAYTALGFLILRDDFTPAAGLSDMVQEFVGQMLFSDSDNIEPATRAARWFVESVNVVWIVVLLLTLVGLLYSSRRPVLPPEHPARLRELLNKYSSSNIEWMLTWDGNDVWLSPDGETAIGYRAVGSVALCLGDPVGPPERRLDALRAFDDFCFDQGWIPCLFAAGPDTAALAPRLRWRAVHVAEDSIVDLEGLELRGKPWQDVRTALNKADKEDIRLVTTSWAEAPPALTDQMRVISQAWVADKALPEMGFTLGTLAEAADPAVRIHLAVREDGTVEGFTSWMPVQEGGEVVGWTIDLMRRREGGFRPVIEFLIGASALQLKDEGYRFISLSAAPLAKAPDSEGAGGEGDRQALDRLLDLLGNQLEPYYHFRSLLNFKAKFQPRFRSMYLVFPDETALAEIGLAITRAYMAEATPRDWVAMSRDMVTHRS